MQATYDNAAQTTLEDAPDAVIPAAPSGDVVGSPASMQKEQRDRLAQEGRRLAALEGRLQNAERRAESAESRAIRLEEDRMRERVTAQDAYLRNLPPDQRIAAEQQLLRREVADLRKTVTQPPQVSVRTEDPVAYQQRRMGEILSEVQRERGVALTGQEDGIDTSSEAAFMASARALATVQTRLGAAGGEETVNQPESEERIAQRVLQGMGVSRPLSPRSVNSASNPVTMESYQNASWDSHDSRRGPRATIEHTRQLREQALQRVDRANR